MLEVDFIKNLLFKAVANEIEIDVYASKLLGFDFSRENVILRPFKSIHKKNKFQFLRIILISKLWFIGIPLLFFAYFFNDLLKGSFKSLKITGFNKIGLLANAKTENLLSKLSKEHYPEILISCNNIKAKSKNCIELRQLSCYKDYFESLILSFYFLYLFSKKNNSIIILQAFVFYNLIVALLTLHRVLSKDMIIVYSNHYDRWAILFDFISKTRKNILIQHGLIDINFCPPTKQHSISSVYAYSKTDFKYFRDKIISNDSVTFNLLKPSIKLIDLDKNEKVSILVVGQPNEVNKELHIMNLLTSTFQNKIDIFLKPHPLYGSNIYLKSLPNNINLIKDVNYYPKVDLVITGYSTLGLEYELAGILTIWHKKTTQQKLLEQINKKIACI